jgi:hypothetical protein
MRTGWAFAVAALLIPVVEAHADTVYLKDGQTVWGREVTEEGDTVIVVRPGETLRFPKGDVGRIDRWRLSVPKYYEPPAAAEGSAADRPASPQPTAPAAAPPPQSPAPSTVAPPAGGTPAAPPVPLAPTVLPPPPPPSADKPR